ncbi:hypothetical protein [Geoglobus sp.]
MGGLSKPLVIALAGLVLLFTACTGDEVQQSSSERLHGTGECDRCHDAYPVKDVAAGLHRAAFEKEPDVHRDLCSKCHDVETFCGECHGVPEIVKNAG